MAASIKRNSDSDEDTGITTGKAYPVQGFIGGGVMIVDDNSKFQHIGFADIDADWTVELDAEKDQAPEPAARQESAPQQQTQQQASTES